MKFEIKIQDVVQQIQDLEYFEYSLGWFEISHREMTISLFKDNLCMIFLNIETLYTAISNLQNDKQQKIKWTGEDNGLFFYLSRDDKKIFFENDKIKFGLSLKNFTKAVSKELVRKIIFLEDLNPNIVYKKLYYQLLDISKFILYR